MPSVLFAGYKVPHPLQPYFIIKVQTDGTITPQIALETACNDLIKMVGDLEGKFKREFAFKDADGATGSNATGGTTAGGDDPYGGGGGWSEGKDYLDF